MSACAISEVKYLDTLDEDMDFILSFDYPPRVMPKFQNLFDCALIAIS